MKKSKCIKVFLIFTVLTLLITFSATIYADVPYEPESQGQVDSGDGNNNNNSGRSTRRTF